MFKQLLLGFRDAILIIAIIGFPALAIYGLIKMVLHIIH
jgi:hypothetical protein